MLQDRDFWCIIIYMKRFMIILAALLLLSLSLSLFACVPAESVAVEDTDYNDGNTSTNIEYDYNYSDNTSAIQEINLGTPRVPNNRRIASRYYTCDISDDAVNLTIESILAEMTIEQKIGQMFFPAFRRDNAGDITRINQTIINAISNYHIGGVILFSENIHSSQQVTEYIASLQNASIQAGNPRLFIAIDEEGGRVARTGALDVPRIPAALTIGDSGDTQLAYNSAKTIAEYLKPLGFNVNFAPVADVFTNPVNTVIGDRAFAREAHLAADMVEAFTKGSLSGGIIPTLKHFPGHGDTVQDSHFSAATIYGTLEELAKREFVPFEAGINAGAPFVMMGHISTPNVTGDNTPALFSNFWIQDILRDKLGFDGVIITDALDMAAVTHYYTAEQAAVQAILAGVDILLMPQNLSRAYAAVLDAVRAGTITEARIDESVRRILTAKYNASIITAK